MPRIKPVEVLNREEAVELINDVARLEIERRQKMNELAKAIQEVQDKYGPEIVALRETIEGKMARITAYVDAHQEIMLAKGKKSGETALADFGYRVSNPTLKTLKKWKWDDVLATMKMDDLMKENYLRYKEEIRKDEIKADFASGKITEEMLKTFGMQVVQDETFWLEPKADKAAQN